MNLNINKIDKVKLQKNNQKKNSKGLYTKYERNMPIIHELVKICVALKK